MTASIKRRLGVGVDRLTLGLVVGALLLQGIVYSISIKGVASYTSAYLALLSVGFLVWACGRWAAAKGHNPAWAAVGVLGVVGLAVVMFGLPDRTGSFGNST